MKKLVEKSSVHAMLILLYYILFFSVLELSSENCLKGILPKSSGFLGPATITLSTTNWSKSMFEKRISRAE